MNLQNLSGLSLRDLEYATTIAQELSFVRAAEVCGVSQPALSQQIKKLEQRLGLRIFERKGRIVAPTQGGRILLERAEKILAQARGLYEISANLSKYLQGDIRMGVIPTIGPYFMPHILPSLRSEFPQMRLLPFEDTTDNLMSQLAQHKIDIALIAAPSPRRDISCARVMFEPFVLACPVDHVLAVPEPVHASDIAALDLLMLSKEHCLRDQTLALCMSTRSDTGRIASSLEMLRQMVAVGEGCALLPALAATDLQNMPGLIKTRIIADPTFGREITMIWRSSDPRASHFSELALFLEQKMDTADFLFTIVR